MSVPGTAAIVVRAGRTDDIEDCANVSTGPIAGKRDYIAESMAARSVRVATVGGEVAGYIIWDRSFFSRPFVWLLGVGTAHRRRGIGAHLLAQFESEHAGAALFTSTNESNHAMQKLLTVRGYVYSGRIEHLDPGDPELFFCRPAAG